MKNIIKICLICIASFSYLSYALAFDPFEQKQGYSSTYSTATGKGVTIAVIDSGVWQGHPDLKRSIWTNNKEIPQNKIDDDDNGYIDDYYGWNFIDNNSDMSPKNNHGTEVAGIISAEHNNGIGIAGIAPDSKVMSLIVCNNLGNCLHKNTIAAIKYAVDNGAKIINLSLGGNGYVGYSSEYDEVIEYAYSHGVVLIASAGNGDIDSSNQIGQDLNFIKASPVCNDVKGINMIIGVGATANNSDMRKKWSNYSSNYVDVWAAGEDLTSTTVPIFSNDYGYQEGLSGTSFSAPIVSAATALLIEKNPNLKVYEIINILSATNPFYINKLLSNAMNDLQCSIKYQKITINNGDLVLLEANNLKSSATFQLKNRSTGKIKQLNNSDFEIIDAKKIKIYTEKLNLSGGIYDLISSNCRCDGSITINGDAKTDNTITNNPSTKKYNRAELIELIKNYLKNRATKITIFTPTSA